MVRHDGCRPGQSIAVYIRPARRDPDYIGRHRETDDSWRESINQVMGMVRLFGIVPWLHGVRREQWSNLSQWPNPFLPTLAVGCKNSGPIADELHAVGLCDPGLEAIERHTAAMKAARELGENT